MASPFHECHHRPASPPHTCCYFVFNSCRCACHPDPVDQHLRPPLHPRPSSRCFYDQEPASFLAFIPQPAWLRILYALVLLVPLPRHANGPTPPIALSQPPIQAVSIESLLAFLLFLAPLVTTFKHIPPQATSNVLPPRPPVSLEYGATPHTLSAFKPISPSSFNVRAVTLAHALSFLHQSTN